MNNNLTVVMYHYVRDLKNSRYPDIKGLDLQLFKEQVDYIGKNYSPVTMEQVVDVSRGIGSLPKKAILLTFDDGYADHFTNVFPILYNKGIQGSFFAPVKAVTQHKVLDVNKIHFILASVKDIDVLLRNIRGLLEKYSKEYGLSSYDEYYSKLAEADRFDTDEVIFIKRLLQVELSTEVRAKITTELFEEAIGVSEGAFSRELYMSLDQIRTMVKCGMHIGSHGFDHLWLGSLSRQDQEVEIQRSIEFIRSMGGNLDYWSICYPYGDCSHDTLELLKEYKCTVGFTTEVKVADISNGLYTLPRLDTNDLPKSATAPVNDWWYKG